jgi:hypothetical protein
MDDAVKARLKALGRKSRGPMPLDAPMHVDEPESFHWWLGERSLPPEIPMEFQGPHYQEWRELRRTEPFSPDIDARPWLAWWRPAPTYRRRFLLRKHPDTDALPTALCADDRRRLEGFNRFRNEADALFLLTIGQFTAGAPAPCARWFKTKNPRREIEEFCIRVGKITGDWSLCEAWAVAHGRGKRTSVEAKIERARERLRFGDAKI